MAVATYNERSGLEFKATLYTFNHEPTIPASVYWTLRCETTSTELQGWTAVTPTTVLTDVGELAECFVTVEIPGSLNAIRNTKNRRELKTLTIAANKDADREFNAELRYYVTNLSGRT